jgi:hypothetical protein
MLISIVQDKYKALEELEENIKLRASEVDFKIRKIQDALLEWHAASQIVSDNCQTSVLHAADKFYNWHQVVPTLSCWLANEARVRSTIYATASMVGINEELLAQKEVKQHLQVPIFFCSRNTSHRTHSIDNIRSVVFIGFF